ncbi:MAG: hypothetical protein ACTSRU_21205 [Candidatus Hodarchaeales archaeon]
MKRTKEIFQQANENIDDELEQLRKNEFANNLRMDLNNGWKQEYGTVSIEYWQGYAQKLESILFDVLNQEN